MNRCDEISQQCTKHMIVLVHMMLMIWSDNETDECGAVWCAHSASNTRCDKSYHRMSMELHDIMISHMRNSLTRSSIRSCPRPHSRPPVYPCLLVTWSCVWCCYMLLLPFGVLMTTSFKSLGVVIDVAVAVAVLDVVLVTGENTVDKEEDVKGIVEDEEEEEGAARIGVRGPGPRPGPGPADQSVDGTADGVEVTGRRDGNGRLMTSNSTETI